MAENDAVFAGSIPEIYDQLLVPLLFDSYASDVTDRIEVLHPGEILEIAAGTGALTRAMSARLPTDVQIMATDLNQPMLDRAQSRSANDNRITWQQADALLLPFEDESFDVVVCQFGVMFFPDKVAGFKEAHRVLRPGGVFLFTVWDAITENEFVSVVSRTLADEFPLDPPSFMARTPHGYYSASTINTDLEAGGFGSTRIETIDHIASAASSWDAAAAYCQGSPLRTEISARNGSLDQVTQVVADALAKQFGPGPIEGRIRALVISAVRS